MRLEMTVVVASGPPLATRGVDVVVTCAPGTPLAAALPDLARLAGARGAVSGVAVSGRPVGPGALLGVPPLLRGAVLDLDDDPSNGSSDGPGSAQPPPGGVLRVTGGQGAGTSAGVPLGRSWVGRDAGSLLAMADRTVSRRHVDLDSSPRGTRVRDAGAANGVLLDGRPLTREWTPLAPGAHLVLGRSQVQLAPTDGAGAPPWPRARPDGLGGLLAPPAPAGTGAGAANGPDGPGATTVVEIPAPPLPRPPTPLAWPAVLVPLLVAVPLALLWSPLALLLAASGPLVALLTRAGDRVAGRRQHRGDLRDHERADAAARGRAARAVLREGRQLDQRHPDPAALREAVRCQDPRAWAAGSGAPLAVRIGCGQRPAGVVLRRAGPAGGGTVVGPGDGDGEGSGDGDGEGSAAEADGQDRTGDERLRHPHGPVVADLGAASRLTVIASPDASLAVLRCLVVQLAVLHGPDDVQVRVLTDRPGDWAWLRWLPHAGGGPLAPGTAPGRGGSASPSGQRWVVVTDTAGEASSAAPGGPRGTRTLAVTPHGTTAEEAVLRLDADGSGIWTGPLADDEAVAALPLVADLPGLQWAEAVARGLAPWRRPGQGADATAPVPSLRELLAAGGPDPGDAAAVAAAWEAGGHRSPAVPLGVHDDGSPWVVDLERDGPHALVAGTTGSGKSSLLVSMVLALASAAPPDELAVVVVDYKGGATAGRLRGLPHLVGAVTDLDAHLARRALASLAAEVRRRERVLAAHGASDRVELLAHRDDGARLLPRLLVVVDEVRVLSEEVPELVPGLVRLAAVGRSLGVHLVLATQRPAGVVSSDARANTNLRIALRVRDAPDSLDVVDDPGAAHLPADAPGAALVRRGGEALQAVRVCAPRRRAPQPLRVELVHDAAAAVDDGPPGEDEVPVLVAALAEAAHGRERVAPPWLPALPEVLAWRSPGELTGQLTGDRRTDDAGTPLALVDDPDAQRQHVIHWSGDAPLAVLGGPRSGRTSLLRWLAAGAADGAGGAPPREVHVVGDPAELGHLAALPWVGTVADPDDGEHVVRLLTALLAGSTGNGGDGGERRPLLLVDRADRVLAAVHDGSSGGPAARAEAEATADLLRRLLEAGAPVVVTGEASLLGPRALGAVREVLLLAPADRTAAVLAGVPSAAVPEHWPPGRALRLRAGPVRECQLPVLGGVAGAAPADGVDVQRRVVADLARGAAPGTPRLGVPALPRLLPLGRLVGLAPAGGDDAAPGSLVVAVGGPAAAPLALPLPLGAGALVTGGPGSGRSGALALLRAQARRAGRPTVLLRPRAGAPTASGGLDGALEEVLDGTGAAPARALLDLVTGPAAGGLVLLDDAELALGTPLEGALLTLLETGSPSCTVVAAGTSGLLPAHRGLVAALRRHRTGLLLHPLAPGDAELLGARASPVRGGPAGRASLVVAGALVVVQLAAA